MDGVITVPSMTGRERAQAKREISRAFAGFYRDNYFRFSGMYAGSVTIQGQDMNYADMLPDRVREEIAIGG